MIKHTIIIPIKGVKDDPKSPREWFADIPCYVAIRCPCTKETFVADGSRYRAHCPKCGRKNRVSLMIYESKSFALDFYKIYSDEDKVRIKFHLREYWYDYKNETIRSREVKFHITYNLTTRRLFYVRIHNRKCYPRDISYKQQINLGGDEKQINNYLGLALKHQEVALYEFIGECYRRMGWHKTPIPHSIPHAFLSMRHPAFANLSFKVCPPVYGTVSRRIKNPRGEKELINQLVGYSVGKKLRRMIDSENELLYLMVMAPIFGGNQDILAKGLRRARVNRVRFNSPIDFVTREQTLLGNRLSRTVNNLINEYPNIFGTKLQAYHMIITMPDFFMFLDTIQMMRRTRREVLLDLGRFDDLNELHDELSEVGRTFDRADYEFEYKDSELAKYEKQIVVGDLVYDFKLPKNSKELRKISRALKNCVSSYDQRIDQAYTRVVYAERDNKPVLCLEVRNNRIVQAVAACNRSPQRDEALAIVEYNKKISLKGEVFHQTVMDEFPV